MHHEQWLNRFCASGQGIIDDEITCVDDEDVISDILSGRVAPLSNVYED